MLPDVKPILTEAEVTTANAVASGQAYPVAVVAQVPPELLVRTEDLDVDKSGQKDKDRNRDTQDNGKHIINYYLFVVLSECHVFQ